ARRARRLRRSGSWCPRGFLFVDGGPVGRTARAPDGRVRPPQADLAVERPQIDARPARPDHEVEAPPRRRAVELDGKVGLELTRERGDADGRADVRGYGDGDVAVVAGEAVAAI